MQNGIGSAASFIYIQIRSGSRLRWLKSTQEQDISNKSVTNFMANLKKVSFYNTMLSWLFLILNVARFSSGGVFICFLYLLDPDLWCHQVDPDPKDCLTVNNMQHVKFLFIFPLFLEWLWWCYRQLSAVPALNRWGYGEELLKWARLWRWLG